MSYQSVKINTDKFNSTLVAVSKTKSNSAIQELYNLGQRDFGENRVQELVEKQRLLPKDIKWHQIGHLQKNKVKYIAPFVHLIHSIDSQALLTTVNSQALKNDRVIDVLLQFKIAEEETKYGLSKAQILEIIDEHSKIENSNIRIRGLMAMASFTNDVEQLRMEFSRAKDLFNMIKNAYNGSHYSFDTLSMGMSGDYELAITCGSNMVRIGSLLFGARL